MRRTKIPGGYGAILSLALMTLALACGPNRSDETPTLQAPPVVVAEVIARDLEERIEATGELQAPLHTLVAAEVGGRITEIGIGEGEAVAAGTAVLEIDPQRRRLEVESAAAGLSQAEASLRNARRQAERVRELGRSSVASAARIDETELALEVAEASVAAQRAQLELAQQALADASVRAPFAGVVGERKVSLGQHVQPGTPLVEFVSLDPIEVVFQLSEIDSGRVKVGQHVGVRVAPWPDEIFDATVDVVYPALDTRSRTLRVKATLSNPAGRLRPGLFARADLGVAVRQGVLMLPEEAVLQRTDGSVVFVFEPGPDGNARVRRHIVRLGRFEGGLVEVQGPIVAGDRVVTRGHAELVDGAVVRLEQPAANVAAGGMPQP